MISGLPAAHAALRIGLTGGIGSGKSTVAAMLAKLGARVIDTDALARALTASGGAAIEPIRAAFGPAFITPDGALDRPAMRHLVFADQRARKQLETIQHPLIQQAAQQAAALAQPGQIVVFDVPLLVESAAYWRPQVDRVLVVNCPPAVQIQRVMRRSGWTAPEVERVIHQQASQAQRLALADDVIHNDSDDLGGLQQQVETLWYNWLNSSAG